MKTVFSFALIIVFFVCSNAQSRLVAITFDDLPTVTNREGETVEKEITDKLLTQITANKIPAIGFVNEGKLYDGNNLEETEVNFLHRWLNAGLELGNHTFSHAELNQMSLEDYEKDVLKGETVTKNLLEAENKRLEYFRHPYLETGADLATKRGLEKFLKLNGYTVAPVTLEASDWLFSDAYDKALLSNDKTLADKIGKAYLLFTSKMIDYATRESNKIFGRNIRQIMLLHANSINADYFDGVVKLLKRKGYKFVSLKKALLDKIYRSPENYVSKDGISWIERWAISQRKKKLLDDEPEVPEFVKKVAGEESE